MAIAERALGAQFNRPGHDIIDHFTYVFLGDGCLMEGISHEACSLAGTLGLGKLIAFYDDNGISIDGEVEGWFTDDTPARSAPTAGRSFPVDGHDPEAVKAAIEAARAPTGQPTLICCRTIIGKGCAEQAGFRGDTRGTPGRGRGRRDPCGDRLAPRTVRDSRRCLRRLGVPAIAARAEAAWEEALSAYAASCVPGARR
jgi:transketolase